MIGPPLTLLSWVLSGPCGLCSVPLTVSVICHSSGLTIWKPQRTLLLSLQQLPGGKEAPPPEISCVPFKPVGLAAWLLVPNPTFIVDLLYPTWQVESSSWLCSSFQEHFTVGTANGGLPLPPLYSAVLWRKEYYLLLWLILLGKAPSCLQ